MQSIHGKVVLITGGTTGIGLAAAMAFVANGAKVVVAARNVEQGAEAQLQLSKLGDAVFYGCDVSNPLSVAALLRFTVEHFGQLNAAVNSAACDFTPAATHEMSFEMASNTISTDVLGVFNCMQQQIQAMLRFGGGTIVNVSSVNGLSGAPTAAMYSAAKHAVIGLTRSTAKEYIGRGVRINAVCPGATETPRRTRRTAHLSEDHLLEHQAQLAKAIPIGRLAQANEIANAILWLSSAASSYVVGHSLVVDGGLHA
ncbi:SDR family NAD(P)-dependent oxidoreductase [Iodobacter sp.]|uniref:SDR family NAD(P)-dependent oxidoreductase n=1 Tax=Iodobacter sp. TaxID=1915058 RepID=UPI0025EC551D|nr:SDR family oxidoreductase [Iodobacter sp.]